MLAPRLKLSALGHKRSNYKIITSVCINFKYLLVTSYIFYLTRTNKSLYNMSGDVIGHEIGLKDAVLV